jgi:hypothetical protein
VTIRDDDETLPSLRIGDASADEVDYYNSSATLILSLDHPGTAPVVAHWQTVDGTAGANDYVADSGYVTFQPGETSKEVEILIRGDVYGERTEIFTVHIDTAENATIADADGTVTIIDNDDIIG